jgi:hypothetical protein
MIAFDLQCANGHAFEGWFASNEAFAGQQQTGEICCPICENNQIHRVLTPVAIRRHGETTPVSEKQPNPRELLRQAYQFLQTHFEDVGTDFAKEALKIHYGAAEKRNIKGTSTADEEQTLRDEGVEFVKIPVPKQES